MKPFGVVPETHSVVSLQNQLNALRVELSDLRRDHVSLMRVSGALCDAGDVPVEPYDKSVRMLTKQRNEAREKLTEAREQIRAIREVMTQAIDILRKYEYCSETEDGYFCPECAGERSDEPANNPVPRGHTTDCAWGKLCARDP